MVFTKSFYTSEYNYIKRQQKIECPCLNVNVTLCVQYVFVPKIKTDLIKKPDKFTIPAKPMGNIVFLLVFKYRDIDNSL